MRPDRSSLRSALATLVMILSWTASAVGALLAWLWTTCRAALGRALSRSRTLLSGSHDLLRGPVRRAVSGPVRDAVLGRRPDVSLLVVMLGPVLALGVALWIGRGVGYETLADWVRGTWYGTAPSTAVFVGVALLIALGGVSAGINSGLLPTTVLVSAPVFGAAVTRYGTEATVATRASVVSLPSAVGIAAVYAAGFGVPIAVCGFLVGVAVRRVVNVVRGESGPSSRADRA